MSHAHDLDRAHKAKAILENPVFQEAFGQVKAALLNDIVNLPMSAKDEAEELRKCLKLLRDVEKNLTTAVTRGNVATFDIEREKQQKKNPFRNYFR